LLHRSDLIPSMKPVKVNVIGSQSLEAGFECLDHILALVAAGIGIAASFSISIFRGHDDFLTVTGDEFPDKTLTRPSGVKIGRINKVAACAAECVVDLFCFLLG